MKTIKNNRILEQKCEPSFCYQFMENVLFYILKHQSMRNKYIFQGLSNLSTSLIYINNLFFLPQNPPHTNI